MSSPFTFSRVRSGVSTAFNPSYGAKLHFANRDTDSLEVTVPSAFLAAGDTVAVAYNGTTVFRGDVATLVESRARGDDATQTVTCAGPWSKMARLVFRQQWKISTSSEYSSRLVLNETLAGATQNLNAALDEIASYAAAPCGFSASAAAVSTQILPPDECRDITVADAIRRELRFFPKAICRFDYSTTPTPTLNISRGAGASSPAYIASVPKTAREYVYNAHPITKVDLEIETLGDTYRSIRHDRAGFAAGETASAPYTDCLYATIQVKGATASVTKQSFKSITENIPSNIATNASWWKSKHPRLANVAENAITITEGTRTISDADCVRISANTAGEITAAGLKCEVSKFTCKATVATTDDKEEDIYLTLEFLTTDAQGTAENPKTYTWVTGSTTSSGESVPSGLAQAILDERAGSLLSERLSIRLAGTFPTLGDAIVEDGGTVFLQSFDVDCGALTADLNFGVPEYLSPEDMAALLSNFRNKRTTTSSSIRASGLSADAGNRIEMGGIKPLSSSEFAPGTKAKTTIKSSGNGSIKLDSTELSSSETVAVRSVTYTDENGDEKTAKVLATEDFPAGGATGVTSVNAASGDLFVIGGSSISVETNGQTIKISYKEGKDPDDDPQPDETDPCEHDPSGGGGGVSPEDDDDDGGSSSSSGGSAGGGVPADGDSHTGDDNCNCS